MIQLTEAEYQRFDRIEKYLLHRKSFLQDWLQNSVMSGEFNNIEHLKAEIKQLEELLK